MKEKKTDIWMPLYIGEYVADTMGFTTEQHGAYLLLLMACWKAKGAVLGDDETLISITKLPAARWRASKAKILSKFQIGDDGTISQKRATKEIAKADRVSNARSNAGKEGAAKRWHQDGKQMANAMANASQNDGQSQSQVIPIEIPPPDQPPLPDRGAGSVGVDLPKGTKAGEVCRAIKLRNIQGVNPGNPELQALIAQGVEIETFEAAADICAKSKPPKGMNYLLGIVRRQLGEAATIAAGPGVQVGPWDETRSSILAKAAQLGIAPWDENDVRAERETFIAYTARVRRAVVQQEGQPA